jgi:hypothetical protein
MAQCTLPILYLNLGGEMMYIIHQRLLAQDIDPVKLHKVMCDLVSQMLDEKCLIELFKYQPLYSKKSLRGVFDRLAQSSIMKLNTESMDKLYDLMLMAVKYQVVLSRRPEEIVLSTLIHLDGMRDLTSGSLEHMGMVAITHKKLREFFSPLTPGQFWHLRQRLLFFFQGMNKRVSVFLRLKAQVESGRFVIPSIRPVNPHSEVPGSIRYFNNGALHLTHKFIPPLIYLPPQPLGSTEMGADRGTQLGRNLYAGMTGAATVSVPGTAEEESVTTETGGSLELTLLARLVGTARRDSGVIIRLSLFNDSDEESDQTGGDQNEKKSIAGSLSSRNSPSSQTVNVKQSAQEKLSKLMDDFNIEDHDSGKKDDLFALLERTS